MTKTKQIEFEERIMQCWHVTQDLDTLFEGVCDSNPELTNDQVANILMGLSDLYNIKFQQLFDLFESALPMKFDQQSEGGDISLG